MSTSRGQRAAQIGDAAIGILAGRGMRGLTHRAVDAAAGLPPGTTSNYARTRAALVELALARMGELEGSEIAALGGGGSGDRGAGDRDVGAGDRGGGAHADRESVAALAADVIRHSVTAARTRMLARYELALEATRRPELRAAYDRAGEFFRSAAVDALAAAGSADPERHARMLVAWAEGIMFDAIAGAGWRQAPSADEIRVTLLEYLGAILPPER